MKRKEATSKSEEKLQQELDENNRQLQELKEQLEEARETIEAIRNGQVDALIVKNESGNQLYTLRSADQTYRVFIEKMNEGAVTLNQDGIILYSNTRFAQMVNLSISGVIGAAFQVFISPVYKDQFSNLFQQGWKSDTKGELNLLKDGEELAVQLSLTTLELEYGLALSVIITDLSFQKQVQQQLKNSNQRLEQMNRELESSNHDLQQFASVASHDLQEPLRKIHLFSNLLSEHFNNLPPDVKKYLEKITMSSRRMRSLITDVLNYSRLSANDTPFDQIDLNEIVREVIEDFELIISEKQADIAVSQLPVIEGNKGQIRQIFQNIISNALKFSSADKKPLITIHTVPIAECSFESPEKKDGDFCLITITDNGIGFDEKFISHIFVLFERLNAKDKYEGSGIGMAITKKIIDKHGGLITAISKIGEGTQFKIILPLRQAPRADQQ